MFEANPVLSRRFALMRALLAARYADEAWKEPQARFPCRESLMSNTTAGFAVYLYPPLLIVHVVLGR